VMNERRQRILGRIAENGEWSTDGLCDVCQDITAVSGVGIMLRTGDVPHGSVGMTNTVSALIEELQFTLGEGPCIDAYNLKQAIVEPDLAGPSRRWPGFTPPVLEAGARAVFAFPLNVGAVSMGSLDLYRDRSGVLADDQHADAVMFASIVAQDVLAMQAQAPPGTLAPALRHIAKGQAVIHQAVGMAAVQLGVKVDEALIRLRAHAFANDRPLAELAGDVVDRRVRFDAASGSKDPTP
jgi:hypothetical protein